jgi:hypothetical protein
LRLPHMLAAKNSPLNNGQFSACRPFEDHLKSE